MTVRFTALKPSVKQQERHSARKPKKLPQILEGSPLRNPVQVQRYFTKRRPIQRQSGILVLFSPSSA